MTSSPSGKATDCKSFIEGSTPSEVSARMLSILRLKIETLDRLLLGKSLSPERVNYFFKLRRNAKNLYNWIADGGDPSPKEIKKWLR